MKNLNEMMKKAQEMQEQMTQMQEKLGKEEVKGAAGGGMVEVRMNGKHEVLGVTVDSSLMDVEEKEVLEDLIAAAVNDAKAKAEAMMQEKMAELTRDLNLPPGMKLPF